MNFSHAFKLYSLALLLFGLFIMPKGIAETVKVLDIRVDFFPNREYSIGLDLDENKMISRIYFDTNGDKTFYSLEDLTQFSTLFKIAGISFVKLKIMEQPSPQSAKIDLQLTQNYLTGSKLDLFFKVDFNANSESYEIQDLRMNRLIHEAEVSTRYKLGLPIGIRALETQ